MRLIHIPTMTLEEFVESETPAYAILSHRWTAGEVTLQEFENPNEAIRSKPGYQKIVDGCHWAQKWELDYFWADTCCIDKTSSADLSEAINSMYRWYSRAKICFAYLNDVGNAAETPSFRSSKWFTRGWTLQELIAPEDLTFFDSTWQPIGTKKKLASQIEEITGIQRRVLTRPWYAFGCSIAERMSWTYVPAWRSVRETSRKEDMAYSLMGLFDVNMPMLYGEGEKAFLRLQEEILKHSRDQTIFAWYDPQALDSAGYSLLATEPKHFRFSKGLQPLTRNIPDRSLITITNNGLSTKAQLVHDRHGIKVLLQCDVADAVVRTQYEPIPSIRPCIYLQCVHILESQFYRIKANSLHLSKVPPTPPVQSMYVRSRSDMLTRLTSAERQGVIRLNLSNLLSPVPGFLSRSDRRCEVKGCWVAPHSFLWTPLTSLCPEQRPYAMPAGATRDKWVWIPTPTEPRGKQYSNLYRLSFSLPFFLNTPALMIEIEGMTTLLLGRGVEGGVGLQEAPAGLLNMAKLQRTSTLGGWVPDLDDDFDFGTQKRSIAFDSGAVVAVSKKAEIKDEHVEHIMHVDLNMTPSDKP